VRYCVDDTLLAYFVTSFYCSQLKSIPLGILFKYVALEGARLLQVRNDIDQHIYLLLDGVLRYMNPIDANHLILAKDLDRSLLFRPYRGPTAIDKVPRSYFNRFPIGDPYNDLSFDNPPAKPSLGVILTNTMMSFSDSSPFNPSMVQLPNGSHLITNRLLVVRQTVTELYLRQPSHNGNNTPLNVTTHLSTTFTFYYCYCIYSTWPYLSPDYSSAVASRQDSPALL
jgi:hypothetical protein